MLQVSRLLLALFTVGLLSGCAHVKVSKLKSEDDYSSGVRFYRPAPHVWILRGEPNEKINTVQEVETQSAEQTEAASAASAAKPESPAKPGPSITQKQEKTVTKSVSGAEAWTLTVVLLPDYSQEYVLAWGAGIGSAAANISLQDGWNLTGFGTSVDSQADEFVGAIATSVATVAAGGAGALTDSDNWKGPGLYKLDFDRKANHFKLGGQVIPAP